MTAVALVGALAVGITPAQSFHSELPVVYNEAVAGSGAFGVRVDTGGGHDVVIDLHGSGPALGSQISLGAAVLDANENLVFMFTFTSHSSPDRLILSPTPIAQSEPAVTAGDVTMLGSGFDYAFTTSATDAVCPFACMGMNFDAAPAGTFYVVTWGGALSGTELFVRSNGPIGVAVSAGTAHVAGDPEIAAGALNAQVQNEGLGVKAMVDAVYPVEAQGKLYGFWGASDFKLACQFTLGVCAWASSVTSLCSFAGVNCGTAHLSYDGPSGGGSGSSLYALLGTAPGSYSFNVDLKVDPYGPNVFDPATGTWLYLGENYSYLTIADVALP